MLDRKLRRLKFSEGCPADCEPCSAADTLNIAGQSIPSESGNSEMGTSDDMQTHREIAVVFDLPQSGMIAGARPGVQKDRVR